MMPKAFIFILNVYLLMRYRSAERKWFYFGILWSYIYFVTLYISFVKVLDLSQIGLRTDFLALTTIPLFLIVNSDKNALEISTKIISFLFKFNFIFMVSEIIVGNYLLWTEQSYLLKYVEPFIAEMSYPTARAISGVLIMRPMGIFGNIHVSTFILYLYFVFLAFQPKPQKWLMASIAVTIFLTLNLQTSLCLVIFAAIYYLPRFNFKYKLLGIFVFLIMMSPMYYFYHPSKKTIEGSSVLWEQTKSGMVRMQEDVFLYGIQFNPNKLADDFTFTSRRGIKKLGLIYDSGLYTLVIRVGIIGIITSFMYVMHLSYMFSREKRRLAFAIIISGCLTTIHYPVFLSIYGSFFFCVLLLILDHLPNDHLKQLKQLETGQQS